MQKSIEVFKKLQQKIDDQFFVLSHRVENRYFCRERQLNFKTVLLTLLNRLSRSLNVELSKFFSQFKSGGFVTKQAFSKARYKLKPSAFIELNQTLIEAYYRDNTHRLYSSKYLLLAVDGSNYELPWFDDIVNEFGYADNTQMSQPRAMATGVKIWDLLNELTVSAKLGAYKASETALFDSLLSETIPLLAGCEQNAYVLVADAYYPGFARMIQLKEQGLDFVIRCQSNYCKEVEAFMKGSELEAVLQIDLQDTGQRRSTLIKAGIVDPPNQIKVRAIRFDLPDGDEGCLLSSIFETDLCLEQIKEVYRFRYGEEVSFYMDKYRAQLENFATKKALGIYQEWHANVLCMNMTQLLIEEAQKKLDEEQEQKPRKYQYKINKSAAIGVVKDEIPKILFGQEDIDEFNHRMIKLIYQFKEPIRPNRSFPRQTKHKLKFNINQRKVL